MNKHLSLQRTLLIVSVPLLIIISMVAITKSGIFQNNANQLAPAIIADLLLTAPFIYFLLIRKTTIPKTTVVPFIILGLVVGYSILPEENQNYLNLFKSWVLPVIELAVLAYIIYNVRKAVKRFKANYNEDTLDVFTTLKTTCRDILPKPTAHLMATEIAIIYYGFIKWKKRQLNTNEFSYHKNTGTLSLLVALIFIIVVETTTLHIIIGKSNIILAWVLTALSIYSILQIFGFLKSMLFRPYELNDSELILRYGIMAETLIPLKDISSVTLSSKDIETNNDTRKLSFLGELEAHNVVISLKKEQTLIGLYGIKRTYKVLALHVDNKSDFKHRIDTLLQATQLKNQN